MANPKHKQMDYRGMEFVVDNVIFVDDEGVETSLRDTTTGGGVSQEDFDALVARVVALEEAAEG